jgi:hypothetical protein
MDLPWGPPHLTQTCSCGATLAIEITTEQIHLGPVELARSMNQADMGAYLAFCQFHEGQGHELGGLDVVSFAPIPQS